MRSGATQDRRDEGFAAAEVRDAGARLAMRQNTNDLGEHVAAYYPLAVRTVLTISNGAVRHRSTRESRMIRSPTATNIKA